MAEADITTLASLADGSPWGPAGRGAFATLQTRLKPSDLASQPQTSITHTADGALAINWATGNHWRVNSAGFDITSVTETNGAAAGRIMQGTIEIINTHVSAPLTVDTTGMDYGLDSVLTVVAGDRELIQVFSTP